MKQTSISVIVAALLTGGLLAGCGGGGTDSSSSGTKLLAQTGCVGSSCYGYNVPSSTSLQFYVNSAPWADLHYTVNGGGQINVRMAVSGTNNTYTVSGLSTGAVVRYFFTIGNSAGGATDTAWMSVTVGSATPTPAPTPTPTPTPTGNVTLYNDCNYGGWAASFGVGSYHLSDMVAHGAANDQASSIRIPAGYKVTLYKDDNFTNTAVTLTGDNSCFVGINFNDMASSMIVSTTSTPTPTPTPTPAPTPTPTGWILGWSDEFNGTALDTSKWNYEVNCDGGGNGELQCYTSRSQNVSVSGGNLVITALQENYLSHSYTSARINTKGKFSQTYGRFEARIKIPTGKGTWPAFWMLGNNIDSVSWPKCGEIDNQEHVNNDPPNYGTIHWADVNGNHVQYGNPSAALDWSQYHVYAIEWDTNDIKWFVDGVQYNDANIANNINNTGAFHLPFFLIANLAIGGSWPGNPDGTTVFPKQMLIDYIRVYHK